MKPQTKAYIVTIISVLVAQGIFMAFSLRPGFNIWIAIISGIIAVVAYFVSIKLFDKSKSK